MVDGVDFRTGLKSFLSQTPADQLQREAAARQQQQQELARQTQARGLAGKALGAIPGVSGPIRELALLDPTQAKQLLEVSGVQGEKRQAQFKEDIRIASSLASQNPALARQQIVRNIERNRNLNIPSPLMERFLTELDDDAPTAVQNLSQLNAALNPVAPSFKERELGIKEETLQVRREEIEQRRLDREASLQLKRDQADIRKLDADAKRETSELKRQELKTQSDQKKRDIQFQASNALDGVQSTIDTIDRLTAGEGLESAAGISSVFPTFPGTQAANFESDLESLKSQAFLTQVEKMKGLGTLTENEGSKLVAAIGALDLSQSDIVLRASLNRIKKTMIGAQIKLQKKFNVEAGINETIRRQEQELFGDQAPPPPQRIGRFTIEVE